MTRLVSARPSSRAGDDGPRIQRGARSSEARLLEHAGAESGLKQLDDACAFRSVTPWMVPPRQRERGFHDRPLVVCFGDDGVDGTLEVVLAVLDQCRDVLHNTHGCIVHAATVL